MTKEKDTNKDPKISEEQMEEYMNMVKFMQMDASKASKEDLKAKLNYLAKLKYQYFQEIDRLTKMEDECRNYLEKKQTSKK